MFLKNVLYCYRGGVNVMEKKTQKQFVKLPEFATMLGITYSGAWKLVKKRKIPAVKVGRSWYVPLEYIQSLQEKGE